MQPVALVDIGFGENLGHLAVQRSPIANAYLDWLGACRPEARPKNRAHGDARGDAHGDD